MSKKLTSLLQGGYIRREKRSRQYIRLYLFIIFSTFIHDSSSARVTRPSGGGSGSSNKTLTAYTLLQVLVECLVVEDLP